MPSPPKKKKAAHRKKKSSVPKKRINPGLFNQYMTSKGDACPYCGAYGEIAVNAERVQSMGTHKLLAHCDCFACDRSWTAEFVLKGIKGHTPVEVVDLRALDKLKADIFGKKEEQ